MINNVIRSYIKDRTVSMYCDFLIKTKKSFIHKEGLKTSRIDFKGELSYKFLKGSMSVNTFIAANKIKKDILEKEDQVSDILDYMEDIKLRRTFINNNTQSLYAPIAYNVDINSAYLTALKNMDLIEENTFEFCNKKLNKKERLAAVGMLAKQMVIFEIKRGININPEGYRTEDAPLRNVFFALVKTIDDLMFEIIKTWSKDVFFYWTDGIYTQNEYIAFLIEEFLNEKGYPSKTEELKDFHSINEYTHQRYSYLKDGKRVIINVPFTKVLKENKERILNKYMLNR